MVVHHRRAGSHDTNLPLRSCLYLRSLARSLLCIPIVVIPMYVWEQVKLHDVVVGCPFFSVGPGTESQQGEPFLPNAGSMLCVIVAFDGQNEGSCPGPSQHLSSVVCGWASVLCAPHEKCQVSQQPQDPLACCTCAPLLFITVCSRAMCCNLSRSH